MEAMGRRRSLDTALYRVTISNQRVAVRKKRQRERGREGYGAHFHFIHPIK